jgi:PmbA protein
MNTEVNMEMKKHLEKVIDLTTKAGAESCDAILNAGQSFSLSAQNNSIDKYNVSGSQVIGVRAIVDNKVGISYTESFDDDAIEFAARAAVENAKSSDANEFEKISIKSEDMISKKEKSNEASTQEKIDFCLRLESEVKEKDSRVQAVPYNGLSESESQSYYLNSLGTFTADSENYLSCYTSALIHEGSQNSMHYHSSIARSLSELDLKACVDESLEHAVNWLDAGAVETGAYDLIFTPDSFVSVFNCFGNIFSAKSAWEKTNPFAEKLGAKVADERLSVKDVPMYQDAFFQYEFDSEAVKRNDLSLIENGVLKSFYHNTATANYFKTTTTAHASRGPKSALGVAGTNRLIATGNSNHSELTGGTYLEIHSLQGLHSGANAISGEFSFGASGYLCRDGKRVQPVKGITVAGNFHKMLQNIRTIGDTLNHNTDKSFFTPLIRFADVRIAGK